MKIDLNLKVKNKNSVVGMGRAEILRAAGRCGLRHCGSGRPAGRTLSLDNIGLPRAKLKALNLS